MNAAVTDFRPAAARRGPMTSPWLAGSAPSPRAPLDGHAKADVAVVGAGIVGTTAALVLARTGARVLLLEGQRIGSGVTGNTTAKLTSLHGLTYASLARSRGSDIAAAYGEMNERGIGLIADLVDEFAIDCDLRRKASYTYTEDSAQTHELLREVEVAAALGLPATFVKAPGLPFEVAGAVRFANQAEFDPVRYLRALADEIERLGGRIHENTRITGLNGKALTTAAGHDVVADRFVVATHLPFLDRGAFFARADPERSYALTVRIQGEVPEGMYLSAGSPARSFRAIPHAGEELWMVGGESHRIGARDPRDAFATLEAVARERFAATSIVHRWAAHDFIGEDGLPYIGAASPTSDRALTVTGLRKWGLAMGSAAAEMLCERILSGARAWPDAFDARRLPRPSSAPALLKHNAASGAHFFADRLRRGAREGIEPGQGAIVGSGLGQRAVYRDEDGGLCELSARCTHLGCIVTWNGAEKTWDCPCHGSRFGPRGEVLEGPAVRPLPPAS